MNFQGKRGRFTGHSVVIELQDPFGFIRRPFDFMETEEIVIGPRDLDLSTEELPFSGDGEVGHSPKKRRTEDLLDVRKYVPGDDWRRLHWKLYAHMGELFLRIGEESPPPQARIWLVFDPFFSSAVPRNSFTLELLDWRIRDFLSKVKDLEVRGFEVKVLVPGTGKSFTVLETGLLIRALGVLDFNQEDTRLPIPTEKGVNPMVFTTPGSPWKDHWKESLEAQGGRCHEIIFPWPDHFTGPPKAAWSWWQSHDKGALKAYKDFQTLKKIYVEVWEGEVENE